MYYVNQHKCKTNEFYHSIKEMCLKMLFTTKYNNVNNLPHEVVLQRDILLLQVPDEVLLNFLDFMDFSKIGITGYCTKNNALGESGEDKMVYVIKYSHCYDIRK